LPYNFDKIISREGSDAVKLEWRKQLFGREDVIPMWVADMDFEVPPFVTEALRKRTEHPIYGYSVLPDSYFQSIIDWEQRRHGWKVEKEWIFYSPGVVTALNLLVDAFTKPGDKIIVQPPVYFPFFSAVEKHKRKLLRNRLKEVNNEYFIDFEDLEEKIREGAKMLILCSPHNPVGRVWRREELERIGNLCLENEVLVISDEIHGDLVQPDFKHIPMASLSEDIAANTVTCIAPSKTFNLAGLFTSSVIIPDEKLRKKFSMAEERISIHPNIFGAVASEAAYNHGDQWLDELLAYIRGNARLVEETLKQDLPGVIVSPLEATYLLWLDFRNLGKTNNEIKEILVNTAGVGMSPGDMFGVPGAGFQRMNLGCPRPVVEEATGKIIQAFK